MNNKPLVRYAEPGDIHNIVDYNAAMALETEALELRLPILTKGVQAVIAEAEKGFYIVVEVDGAVRGSLMVTTEWSDWRNGTFWWIQSVFVEKKFRKQGLYKAMYTFLQEKADTDDEVVGIRLYVEKENKIAQQTYSNLGMHQTHYLLYEYAIKRITI